MVEKEDKLAKYPSTETFRVKDTIGVPHPYCITPCHVNYAATHCGGILGAEAIRESEMKGGHKCRCDICKGKLPYDEHKQELLIEVDDGGKELKDVPGLQEYLVSIRDMIVADGFEGAAFCKKKR